MRVRWGHEEFLALCLVGPAIALGCLVVLVWDGVRGLWSD